MPGNRLRSFSTDPRASSSYPAAASAARLKTGALFRSNQNAMTEDARRNRYADFLLRGVLGMVAGARATARHAISGREHQKMTESTEMRFRIAPTSVTPIAPTSGGKIAPTSERMIAPIERRVQCVIA